MQKKTYLSLFFILIITVTSFVQKNTVRNWKHNGISYSTDDYSEYKDSYARLFRKTADRLVSKCICDKMPNEFDDHIKDKEHVSIIIEPLYVSKETCTGIYAERIFGRRSARYRDGHPHTIFLLEEENFIAFGYRDSVKLKEILFSKEHLFQKLYTTPELDSIYDHIKYGRIWTDASIVAPYKIKENGKTLYDAFHE